MAGRAPEARITSNGGSWVATDRKERQMDRYARRKFFERLCELRDDYGRLGSDDTTSVIAIETMIERAVELLERPASPLIVMLEGGRETA
jgi:hypothetical protein